jgi:glycerol dehydrogenase
VLAGLFLTDRPSHLIDEVFDFCESVGLPTTLSDIGIADASNGELQRVAEVACADGETIHHEPCSISPAAVYAALRTADQVGRNRQQPGGP